MKNGTFVRHAMTHIFIIALGLFMIYPVAWMIVSSFKPNNLIFSDPGLIPQTVTFENYVTGWKGYAGTSFGTFFTNSLLMCAVAIVGNLISCSMAAYAFARLKFAGKGFWFAVMMATLMLPGHVTLVPRYIMFNTFGWVGTYLPILVPKFLATDAFFVFLLVQFMRSLPKEIEEAAIIDGCSKVGVFLRVIIPLASPALVTTALFTFLWTWDDFFNHLLYLTRPDTYTVSRALRTFVGDAGAVSNWGGALAMSTLSIVPAFILFFSLQKYFVQGITTTGLKG
ncbi:carbohydrate ABC transporter permease [Phototrophicus methaneseepsis]|uniref:Carbohydrate ABC transporter permease n=1 Tax=Phototrophicus methaneseepsis TaxID=2710758 RepID=A0A7S8IGS2_9CHLR|nr:carbohydrate ABC transporter permease [Phototrophicus methaneseepsis]QPC84974.1 carbohydrate ABC transporter permease [Phototrophicus methaneseepsis]